MTSDQRSFGGASLWMLVGQAVSIGVSLVSIAVLSRMLPAEDFGLVAMVTVFSSVGSLLTDLGLATSALRAPHLSHHQASNLFWINTALGTVSMLSLITLAPLVATVYGDSRLQPIAIALAFGLLASGLQTQFQIQLARDAKFGRLAVAGTASAFLGLLAAIASASLGWGYWALVAQSLTSSYTSLIFKIQASGWRPAAPRRRVGTKELSVSGAHFFGSGALHQLTANADSFAIGLNWGAAPVGVFGRARQLADLPITLLTPIINVVVPGLIADRAAKRDVQKRLMRLQGSIGTLGIGLLAMIAAAAPGLIPLALGPDWGEVVTLFRILAVGTAARTLTQVSYWAFTALGSSQEWLRYNIASKLVTTSLIVGGAFISFEAVAVGQALGSILSWLLNIGWLGRTTELKSTPFYLNGTRILLSGFIAGATGSVMPPASTTIATILLQATISCLVFLFLIALTKAGRMDLMGLCSAVRRLSGFRGAM